jgi:hypothetical protein
MNTKGLNDHQVIQRLTDLRGRIILEDWIVEAQNNKEYPAYASMCAKIIWVYIKSFW